jgi:hypothetical protein
MGAYKGKASTIKEAEEKTNGFKKGGKAMAKKVMSAAAMDKDERPARKSGGGVFSSASAGTARGKASHY